MKVSGSTDFSTLEIFTTGEAAKVCKVSQQTIIRCFDSGRLGGFKVPGSTHRKIPRAELLKFMKKQGIPSAPLTGESEEEGHIFVLAGCMDDVSAKLGGLKPVTIISTPWSVQARIEAGRPRLVAVCPLYLSRFLPHEQTALAELIKSAGLTPYVVGESDVESGFTALSKFAEAPQT